MQLVTVRVINGDHKRLVLKLRRQWHGRDCCRDHNLWLILFSLSLTHSFPANQSAVAKAIDYLAWFFCWPSSLHHSSWCVWWELEAKPATITRSTFCFIDISSLLHCKSWYHLFSLSLPHWWICLIFHEKKNRSRAQYCASFFPTQNPASRALFALLT